MDERNGGPELNATCNAWCTGIDVDTAPQEKSRENGNVYSIEVQQNTTVRPNLSANWNWKTARI